VIALQETRALLPLDGKFTPGRQRALVVDVMKAMGFEFDRAGSMKASTPLRRACRATCG